MDLAEDHVNSHDKSDRFGSMSRWIGIQTDMPTVRWIEAAEQKKSSLLPGEKKMMTTVHKVAATLSFEQGMPPRHIIGNGWGYYFFISGKCIFLKYLWKIPRKGIVAVWVSLWYLSWLRNSRLSCRWTDQDLSLICRLFIPGNASKSEVHVRVSLEFWWILM